MQTASATAALSWPPQGGTARFVLKSIARRWALALCVALGTFALAWASVALLPRTWLVETELFAGPDRVMGALGNPASAVPRGEDTPARLAREVVLSRDNLVQVARRTSLMQRWEETRTPAGRLADRVRDALLGPMSESRRFDVLIDLLERRLYVTPGPEKVTIGIRWHDGPTAYHVVQAAQDVFLKTLQAREQGIIRDAIEILEKRAAEARKDADAALFALGAQRAMQRKLGGTSARERENLRVGMLLSARRQAIENLERERRMRLEELEERLAQQRAMLSDTHPDVLATGRRLTELVEESPELSSLREEEEVLDREYQRVSRGGRAPVILEEDPAEDAVTAYARSRLKTALERYDLMLSRIDAARIELDVADAAFRHRYAVIRPAQEPRRPARPDVAAVLAGGLIAGLALGAAAATRAEARGMQARSLAAGALALALGAATVGTLHATANPVIALAPALLLGLGWATVRLPLRASALTFVFLMLAMPPPSDAARKFEFPWAVIGRLLQANLNKTIPVDALRFAGADVVLAGLLLLALWRAVTGSKADRAGMIPLPRPVRVASLASLAGVLAWIAWGLASGGNFGQVLWQTHLLVFLPGAILLLDLSLRGPDDLRLLGKVVLGAALLKAAQTFWVRYAMDLDPNAVPTATSHSDSMLFAIGICIVLAQLAEHPVRRNLLWCVLLIPPLALAIRANNRRLAWVELGGALVLMFLVSHRTRLKVFFSRAALALSPLFLAYLVAGWNGQARIFGPVAKIRSIVDSSTNRSTAERDVENYNLVRNLRERPIAGLGFGHEYQLWVMPDDISHIFPQWRFMPHNSVLALFAFGGLLGAFAIWSVLTAGLFFAGRAYAKERAPPIVRAAALSAICMPLIYFLQCYGDMGLFAWNSVFLLAPAVVASGKAAVAAGAWGNAA